MPAILGGDSPCQQPPKGVKKGAFIYKNDSNAKKLSNLSLGSNECDWTGARKFRWGLPPTSNPQRVRKGSLI